VDFVHRTFQEYLAAMAAVDNDEIGQLVAIAHDDQWREVVVMAAGHAQPAQVSELLHGLLKRGRRRAQVGRIGPLAVACAQTAQRLDPQLRADVERLGERLVPPEDNEAAESLAGAGEMLLDLLRAKPPRSPNEAGASIRAASRIGGTAALRLIGDILAEHVRPSRSPVDDETIGAWRVFKPEQYVTEVLARSWPAEKELQVPDPAFLEAVRLFPGLRAIRCEQCGASGPGGPAFTPGQELRNVTLTGCDEDLDLSPLLRLPSLENVELSARGPLLGLAVLGAVLGEWTLTLESPACADRLAELAGLDTLTRLHMRGGDDLRDLGGLLTRPSALQSLSLFGFPNLPSLDGIERWQGLVAIVLFDCPQVTSFAALASLTSLENVSLGLFPDYPRDLSLLATLPRLRKLSLQGHSEFDVNSLVGARDLLVVVPPGQGGRGRQARASVSGDRICEVPVRIPRRHRFLRLSPGIPRVVENYLLPREEVVIAVRRHPGAFISHFLLLGCCCAAACLITVLTDSGPLILAAVWVVFLAVLVWLLIRVSAWSESVLAVTEVRLIFITGLVTPKVVSVPLREIANLKKRRSPLGRLIGYGEFIAEPVRPGYTIPKMNYMPYLEQLLSECRTSCTSSSPTTPETDLRRVSSSPARRRA
jgi:hypothetical protein